jgi:dCTP deaminase
LALQAQLLIVDPAPTEIDTTSIDLHLDVIEEAKLWDVAGFAEQQRQMGNEPILGVGSFALRSFSEHFAIPLADREHAEEGTRVYRDGNRVILEPGGFFLWQTKEVVGAPEVDPRLICFVDGKSTRARTGLLVHMTAPTLHAGWWGNVTLEIANLGPFRLALKEGDAIAQIVVAALSSPPTKKKETRGVPIGQQHVEGVGGSTPPAPRRRKGK